MTTINIIQELEQEINEAQQERDSIEYGVSDLLEELQNEWDKTSQTSKCHHSNLIEDLHEIRRIIERDRNLALEIIRLETTVDMLKKTWLQEKGDS